MPLSGIGCNYDATAVNEPNNWNGSLHTGISPYGGGESIQTCSGWGSNENMVWYTFDVNNNTQQPITITINNVNCNNSGAGTAQMGIFTNTQPCSSDGSAASGLGTETGLGCATGNGSLSVTLPSQLPNGNYYVVVDGSDGDECVWEFESAQTLPINLINFDGYAEDDNNLIMWSAYEQNCSYYEVQRAENGTFTSIGQVTASTASGELGSYSFTDANPLNNSYYRLKQVDFDGQYEITKTIQVNRGVENLQISNIYPMPATEFINIEIESPILSEAFITIYDMTGKTIHNAKNISLLKGKNTVNMNTSSLSTGYYLLVVQNNTEVTTKKIMIR